MGRRIVSGASQSGNAKSYRGRSASSNSAGQASKATGSAHPRTARSRRRDTHEQDMPSRSASARRSAGAGVQAINRKSSFVESSQRSGAARHDGNTPSKEVGNAKSSGRGLFKFRRKHDSHEERQPRSVSGMQTDAAKATSGAFVDARKLAGDDVLDRTLQETTGTLGIMSRPKVVDFNARLKEKRKAGLRSIVSRVAITVVSLGVVIGLVWLLFFSPVLRLEAANISINGANEWVSEQQIRDIAQQQAGKSLLLVSTNDVTTKLKDIPGVTQAEAKRKFPQGMEVTVTAQKPAAMLKVGDSALTAVDSQARVLNSVNGASAEGIPVIEVESVDSGLQNRAVKEALKILSALPESMRSSVTAVKAQTQDSITTELNGGDRIIVWGDSSELKLKMAVVDKIINDPTKIGDKHQVDVSAPYRPIIK